MPFPQFVDLMENKRLWFPSLKTLQVLDPFEGFPSDEFFSRRIRDFAAETSDFMDSRGGHSRRTLENEAERLKHSFDEFFSNSFVSCWHKQPHEDYAMWKAYGGNELPVAITSTPAGIVSAFQDNVVSKLILDSNRALYSNNRLILNRVNYGDIEMLAKNSTKNIGSKQYILERKLMTDSAFLKRLEFQSEHEFRFLLSVDNWFWRERPEGFGVLPPIGFDRLIDTENVRQSVSGAGGNIRIGESVPGVYFEFDPVSSIDEILVSPGASPWQIEMVRALAARHGFAAEDVRGSALAARPDVFSAAAVIAGELELDEVRDENR
jgi:hypothetical protein